MRRNQKEGIKIKKQQKLLKRNQDLRKRTKALALQVIRLDPATPIATAAQMIGSRGFWL